MSLHLEYLLIELLLTIAAPDVSPLQNCPRSWENTQCQKSPPMAFERLDEETGRVHFLGESGKHYSYPLEKLSAAEQRVVEQLSRPALTDILFVRQDDAPLLQMQNSKVRYGKPRLRPEDPWQEVTTREVPYTVQVPERRMVRTYERFGLCRRKCRVVWRSMTTMRSETRTRSVSQIQTGPSLIADSNAAVIILDLPPLAVPASAGAIARQIAGLLDARFPEDRFDFVRNADDNVVDFQQRTPVGNLVVQILVEIDPADPRNVRLTVAARNDDNRPMSQMDAQTLFDDLQIEITGMAPPT
jgi:hypothetical protein